MKLFRYLLLAIAAFGLHSCDNATEEIYLNEDGSGEYKIYVDMIPAMRKMMTEMALLFDTAQTEKMNEEAVKYAIEERIWEDFPEGEIDSVFNFADVLEPDQLDEPAEQEMAKRMTGFMQGSREKGYLNTGAKYAFRDMADLQAFGNKLEENKKKGSGGTGGLPGMMSSLDELKTATKYDFKNGVFKRTTKFISKAKITEEDMKTMQKMFGDAKMKTILHLPKNAKEVKGENVVSKEGKTVVFEYSMIGYLQGKVNTDFEIVME